MLVFEENGKTGVPGERPLGADTLKEGERSHHCANPAQKLLRWLQGWLSRLETRNRRSFGPISLHVN